MLTFELMRIPRPEPVVKRKAFSTADRVVRRTRGATEARILAVMTRERVNFSQICERVGCLRTLAVHELVSRMVRRGVLQSRKVGKRFFYWVSA